MIRCLGVLRELTNSPHRELDDRLILEAVLARLEHAGIPTRLMTPEQFDAADPVGIDLIVPMCESYTRLMRLKDRPPRAALVNAPEAVLNCYRVRMTRLLSQYPPIGFPPTEVRRVEEGPGAAPAFAAPRGWWVKRGDVHNTCDRDVVFLREWSGLDAVLKDFQSREITHFVAQPHLDGDLVKFYGVGPGRWFTWFYHDPARAERIPFETPELAGVVGAAAAAVGLEVFGGDAIIAPGRVHLIDINSWPSFARVRPEAAAQIAAHLRARLREAGGAAAASPTRTP